MIISGAFDQIKVFGKMFGGYFFLKKKEISSMARQKRREPMIKYKHLFICSGATPIGSAGHAPDKDGRIRKDNNITTRDVKMVSLQPSTST
jgi:hypothetical protein